MRHRLTFLIIRKKGCSLSNQCQLSHWGRTHLNYVVYLKTATAAVKILNEINSRAPLMNCCCIEIIIITNDVIIIVLNINPNICEMIYNYWWMFYDLITLTEHLLFSNIGCHTRDCTATERWKEKEKDRIWN